MHEVGQQSFCSEALSLLHQALVLPLSCSFKSHMGGVHQIMMDSYDIDTTFSPCCYITQSVSLRCNLVTIECYPQKIRSAVIPSLYHVRMHYFTPLSIRHDKSGHLTAYSAYASKFLIIFFYWLIRKTVKSQEESFWPFVNICFRCRDMSLQSLRNLEKNAKRKLSILCPFNKNCDVTIELLLIQYLKALISGTEVDINKR